MNIWSRTSSKQEAQSLSSFDKTSFNSSFSFLDRSSPHFPSGGLDETRGELLAPRASPEQLPKSLLRPSLRIFSSYSAFSLACLSATSESSSMLIRASDQLGSIQGLRLSQSLLTSQQEVHRHRCLRWRSRRARWRWRSARHVELHEIGSLRRGAAGGALRDPKGRRRGQTERLDHHGALVNGHVVLLGGQVDPDPAPEGAVRRGRLESEVVMPRWWEA